MTLVPTEPKKIYMWVEAQPITTAGIYHNEELGLISLSSDGINWTTIADKNLGATTVYNTGDTLSESNCGKFYQRGNNYGFSFTGPTTTSSTLVNATNYGPGNYYNSSTFVKTTDYTSGWDTSGNVNLWGGQTDTNESKKGPCDTGYHIGNKTEMESIISIGISLGAWTDSNGTGLKTYLKIPRAGMIAANTGTSSSSGNACRIWSATAKDKGYSWSILGNGSYSRVDNILTKGMGANIRPIKNEAVQPREGWTKLK